MADSSEELTLPNLEGEALERWQAECHQRRIEAPITHDNGFTHCIARDDLERFEAILAQYTRQYEHKPDYAWFYLLAAEHHSPKILGFLLDAHRDKFSLLVTDKRGHDAMMLAMSCPWENLTSNEARWQQDQVVLMLLNEDAFRLSGKTPLYWQAMTEAMAVSLEDFRSVSVISSDDGTDQKCYHQNGLALSFMIKNAIVGRDWSGQELSIYKLPLVKNLMEIPFGRVAVYTQIDEQWQSITVYRSGTELLDIDDKPIGRIDRTYQVDGEWETFPETYVSDDVDDSITLVEAIKTAHTDRVASLLTLSHKHAVQQQRQISIENQIAALSLGDDSEDNLKALQGALGMVQEAVDDVTAPHTRMLLQDKLLHRQVQLACEAGAHAYAVYLLMSNIQAKEETGVNNHQDLALLAQTVCYLHAPLSAVLAIRQRHRISPRDYFDLLHNLPLLDEDGAFILDEHGVSKKDFSRYLLLLYIKHYDCFEQGRERVLTSLCARTLGLSDKGYTKLSDLFAYDDGSKFDFKTFALYPEAYLQQDDGRYALDCDTLTQVWATGQTRYVETELERLEGKLQLALWRCAVEGDVTLSPESLLDVCESLSSSWQEDVRTPGIVRVLEHHRALEKNRSLLEIFLAVGETDINAPWWRGKCFLRHTLRELIQYLRTFDAAETPIPQWLRLGTQKYSLFHILLTQELLSLDELEYCLSLGVQVVVPGHRDVLQYMIGLMVDSHGQVQLGWLDKLDRFFFLAEHYPREEIDREWQEDFWNACLAMFRMEECPQLDLGHMSADDIYRLFKLSARICPAYKGIYLLTPLRMAVRISSTLGPGLEHLVSIFLEQRITIAPLQQSEVVDAHEALRDAVFFDDDVSLCKLIGWLDSHATAEDATPISYTDLFRTAVSDRRNSVLKYLIENHLEAIDFADIDNALELAAMHERYDFDVFNILLSLDAYNNPRTLRHFVNFIERERNSIPENHRFRVLRVIAEHFPVQECDWSAAVCSLYLSPEGFCYDREHLYSQTEQEATSLEQTDNSELDIIFSKLPFEKICIGLGLRSPPNNVPALACLLHSTTVTNVSITAPDWQGFVIPIDSVRTITNPITKRNRGYRAQHEQVCDAMQSATVMANEGEQTSALQALVEAEVILESLRAANYFYAPQLAQQFKQTEQRAAVALGFESAEAPEFVALKQNAKTQYDYNHGPIPTLLKVTVGVATIASAIALGLLCGFHILSLAVTLAIGLGAAAFAASTYVAKNYVFTESNLQTVSQLDCTQSLLSCWNGTGADNVVSSELEPVSGDVPGCEG